MPYITDAQRQSLEQGPDGRHAFTSAIAGACRSLGAGLIALGARYFMARAIERAYDETLFREEDIRSDDDLSGAQIETLSRLEAFAQEFGVRAKAIMDSEKAEPAGLLNYFFTRFFNELYPGARYRDYNEMAGIFSSLGRLCDARAINPLGLIDCCKTEYYRKYAAPYEDLKETENGAVERPSAKPKSY